MTEPIARDMRAIIKRLQGPHGAMGRDERMHVMRRLLDAEPDSATMLRLSAHAYMYARELREREDRAERLAEGQLELDA